MTTNLQTFSRAAHMLRNVAVRVPDTAWDNPSCCDGWSARQVAGHATWVLNTITAGATGQDKPDPQAEAEIAGADPATTICSAVDGCLDALDQANALNIEFESLFGQMKMDDFLGAIFADPLAHAWDLADAAGIAHGIDSGMAAVAMATLTPASDSLRAPGMMADIVESSSADPVEQMIAFTGRTSVNA